MKISKNWKRLYINLLVAIKGFRKNFRNRFQAVEVELYDLNKVAAPYFKYINFALVILAVISLIASEAFVLNEKYARWNTFLEFAIVGGFAFTYLSRLILTSKRLQLIRGRLIESILFFLLCLVGFLFLIDKESIIRSIGYLLGFENLLPLLVLATKLYLIILVVNKLIRAAPIVLSLKRKPTQVVAGSFISVIIIGALLLMTPKGYR